VGNAGGLNPAKGQQEEARVKMQDRVAIVTGSAQGIGRAIAEKLSREGATVVVADLNAGLANEVAGSLGSAKALEVDVTSEESVERMVEDTVSEFGRIDAIVNNAGIAAPFAPWEKLDFAEWRRVMTVNLDSVFLTCKAVTGPMREAGYGRIVNISSNSFIDGTPNFSHYIASKGGVLGLTRAIAGELGAYGITANAVAPGLTETEKTTSGPFAEAWDFVLPLQAIPRRAQPSDIAPAVAFLASEESGWVTGAMIVADGGYTRH